MDKIQHKVSGGDPKRLMMISGAAIIGAFSAMSSNQLVALNKNSIACISGGVIMAILIILGEKVKAKWLNEWNLTIAILGEQWLLQYFFKITIFLKELGGKMGNNNYYENEYMPRMHKIGIITNILGVIASFLPAIALAVVYGLLPPAGALVTAFISAVTAFGFLWAIEPISHFSVLGPIGTYMAFISGNISNMRVPCAGMARIAAEVEPVTEKESIISVLGMAVSIVINISVLTIGVILGSSILSRVSPKVTEALNYLLPSLFGALFVQFGMRSKSLASGILVFSVMINIALKAGVFKWLPGANNYLAVLTSVFLAIAVTLSTYKKVDKGENQNK